MYTSTPLPLEPTQFNSKSISHVPNMPGFVSHQIPTKKPTNLKKSKGVEIMSPPVASHFVIIPLTHTRLLLCFNIKSGQTIHSISNCTPFKFQAEPDALNHIDHLWRKVSIRQQFGSFICCISASSLGMTNLIRNIRPFTIGMAVRARVALEWRPRLFDSLEYDGLHYLLVDEEGSSIHAMIDECYYGHMPKLMKVGQVYDIRWFGSKRDTARQRVCQRDIILTFTAKTEFNEFKEDISTVPRYAFKFIEFAQLQREVDHQTLLADLYGCIKAVKEPIEITVKNSKRKQIRADIKFMFIGREEIKITLWGDVAASFPIQKISESLEPVLAAFTAMRITKYEGYVGASSTNHTCIILNPRIEQTDKYKTEFSRTGDKVNVFATRSKLTLSGEINETDMKTVVELKTLDPAIHMSKSVYCSGVVARFFAEKGWWYNACSHDKCYKVMLKNETQEDNYFCSVHGQNEPKRSYRVFMIIEDELDQASITIMGKAAEEFFQATCEELLKKRFYPTESTLPPEISCNIGREFLFEINVNQHVQFYLRNTYETEAANKKTATEKPLQDEHQPEELILDTPEKRSAPKRTTDRSAAIKLFLNEINKEGNQDDCGSSSAT